MQYLFLVECAFSVAAQSKMILEIGTRPLQCFWISEDATSMGTFYVYERNCPRQQVLAVCEQMDNLEA